MTHPSGEAESWACTRDKQPLFVRWLGLWLACLCLCMTALTEQVRASPSDAIPSVVSVLPVWSEGARPSGANGRRIAPEGSGVVIRPGVIATAWHVIAPAERIDVRLHDGRVLPADIIAYDDATDIALMSVDADLQAMTISLDPEVAQRACAIGNAFGLGLSVTCGIVSANSVSNAGFNPVEDFVQTDAAINPGSSGGALVDDLGRLLGMVSAIFASDGDTNTGVGFAVSSALLERITTALLDEGEVRFAEPGWTLVEASRESLTRVAAPVVQSITDGGPAAQAGLRPGDLILAIESHRVRTARDAIAGVALIPQTEQSYVVEVEREGRILEVAVPFETSTAPRADSVQNSGDCPHPVPVCVVRQAVFPVSSFDPLGSATRIGPSLLVTNRHVVGDRMDATVFTPVGPREARVVPSAYRGDLVLLEVDGLPEAGLIPDLPQGTVSPGTFFAIGADAARQEIRVFAPGGLILGPAPEALHGRVHVTSAMQPGVSGGALVSDGGELVGIAVGGGDGRYEAIPISDVGTLLNLRAADDALNVTMSMGLAYAECAAAIDAVGPGRAEQAELDALRKRCLAADNQGQLLDAGRTLATARDFGGATDLFNAAVSQVPHSINARISLLVALQLDARFEEMLPHAEWLVETTPDDPQVLRFAIQSGVWGNARELAERGYQALLRADPIQAEAARRFIDDPPPAPARRSP